MRALLQFGTQQWNDASALVEIYAADAVVYDDDDDENRWIRGAEAVATFVAGRFPGGPNRTLPALGHRPQAEGPDQVNAMIRGFA